MNEQQIRSSVATIAESFLGLNEKDGSYLKILDIYNAYTPHPRGYAMQPKDAWCAAFVSAVAITAGLTDIIPVECSCNEMIKLFRNHIASKWIEDDGICPEIGDIIFYDWQDTGRGDDRGSAEHVGIVVTVSGNSFTVIEGNYSNSVKARTLECDGRFIRGFGKPAYNMKESDEPSRWAKEAADWAIEKKILRGDGSGNYRWHETVTREEAAQMLYNALHGKW